MLVYLRYFWAKTRPNDIIFGMKTYKTFIYDTETIWGWETKQRLIYFHTASCGSMICIVQQHSSLNLCATSPSPTLTIKWPCVKSYLVRGKTNIKTMWGWPDGSIKINLDRIGDGFMLFPRTLARSITILFWIWTLIANSISSNDNCYTKYASKSNYTI